MPEEDKKARPAPTEAERQRKLTDAMRNRLEAAAKKAGKGSMEARLAMARIFAAIEYQQQALHCFQPSDKTQEAIWKWRNNARKMSPDFAAPIVRMVAIRKGVGKRKRSEDASIEMAAGVTFDALSAIEKRAARILMGQGRATRNVDDKATKIARVALADWGTSPEYSRPRKPRLTLETIIRVAIPFIEELSGERLRGANEAKDAHAIEIEPPALGALVALARMNKEGASLKYVSDIIAKHHAQQADKKQ
jgi:hypothetical protein